MTIVVGGTIETTTVHLQDPHRHLAAGLIPARTVIVGIGGEKESVTLRQDRLQLKGEDVRDVKTMMVGMFKCGDY